MNCPLCDKHVPRLIHHLGYNHKLNAAQARVVMDNSDNEGVLQEIRNLLKERDARKVKL